MGFGNNRKSKKQETIHNIAHNISEAKVGSITPTHLPYQSDPESEHVKIVNSVLKQVLDLLTIFTPLLQSN